MRVVPRGKRTRRRGRTARSALCCTYNQPALRVRRLRLPRFPDVRGRLRERELVALEVHPHDVALAELAAQDPLRQRVLDATLRSSAAAAARRTRGRSPPSPALPSPRPSASKSTLRSARRSRTSCSIRSTICRSSVSVSGSKTMISSTRLRNSGRNALAQRLLDLLLPQLARAVVRGAARDEAERARASRRSCPGSTVMMIDRVAEVHRAPLAVGQPSVLQDLQQHVEHVRVRLLDLVEQDHAVRAPPHGLGQPAALVVADVPGRRADQARHRVPLLVLRHVDADHRVLVVEHVPRQRACASSVLPTPVGPEEDEAADRPLRVLEPDRARAGSRPTRASTALSWPMTALVQRLLHVQQLLRLALEHAAAPGCP